MAPIEFYAISDPDSASTAVMMYGTLRIRRRPRCCGATLYELRIGNPVDVVGKYKDMGARRKNEFSALVRYQGTLITGCDKTGALLRVPENWQDGEAKKPTGMVELEEVGCPVPNFKIEWAFGDVNGNLVIGSHGCARPADRSNVIVAGGTPIQCTHVSSWSTLFRRIRRITDVHEAFHEACERDGNTLYMCPRHIQHRKGGKREGGRFFIVHDRLRDTVRVFPLVVPSAFPITSSFGVSDLRLVQRGKWFRRGFLTFVAPFTEETTDEKGNKKCSTFMSVIEFDGKNAQVVCAEPIAGQKVEGVYVNSGKITDNAIVL